MKRQQKVSRRAHKKGVSAEAKKAQRRAERIEARQLLRQQKYDDLDRQQRRAYFGWD